MASRPRHRKRRWPAGGGRSRGAGPARKRRAAARRPPTARGRTWPSVGASPPSTVACPRGDPARSAGATPRGRARGRTQRRLGRWHQTRRGGAVCRSRAASRVCSCREHRGPTTEPPDGLAGRVLPIQNTDEERDLRHLAVGRKNWLVFGSQRGGDVACRLYSLVLSCKQAGIDPERYIEDVLSRLSTTKASEIASLTTWAWAAARR